MNTIAIIGQKGGTGKTTVAVALAVTAALAGEAVIVLDMDPQVNAQSWANRREDDTSTEVNVVAVSPGRLRQGVEAAQKGGADLILIDTPGKNETLAAEAAKLADLVLIPCNPTIFHMETLPASRATLRTAGDPPAFVIYTNVHPHPHAQGLMDSLKKATQEAYDIKPCPIHLTSRTIWPESQHRGKSPQEIQKSSPAAAELESLYLFVTKAIKQGKKHGKKTVTG